MSVEPGEAYQRIALAQEMRTRRPVTTWLLAAGILAMFGLEIIFGSGNSLVALGRMGALNGGEIARGKWWEILSHAFLHAGFLHVGMNLLALMSLAPFLEVVLGGRRMFIAFVLSALAGGALAATFGNRSMVGASGGIWGLMTLTTVLILRPNPLIPRALGEALRGRMVRAVLINGAISLLPGISMLGHLGGGLAGAVLGLLPGFRRGVRPAWDRLKVDGQDSGWVVPGFLVLAVLALVSIGAALHDGRPWELLRPLAWKPVALGDTGLHIDVPDQLRHRPVEHEKQSEVFTFGDLSRDGLVEQIEVTPLAAPVPDPGPALASIRESLKPENGSHLISLDQKGDGSGARLLLKAASDGGANYSLYVFFAGGARVSLWVLEFNPPPKWQGMEERIYRSMQPTVPAGPTP